MRKAIVFAIALVLATIVVTAMPMNAIAAKFTSITPSKGKVGNAAVVHGEGFKGGAVTVKFGSADPVPAATPSDKVGKVKIPNKVATDPNPVPVKIFIDEVLVPGDILFEYDPAGPEPAIGGFSPPSTLVGIEFSIEIVGTCFTTPHNRMPDQIVLIGPDAIWGWVVPDGVTDTSFMAEFPPVIIPGIYEIIVGFNDGSGATADGFDVT